MNVTFLVLLLQRSLTHGLTTNTFDENNDETFFLNQIADIIKENPDQNTNHKYPSMESESDKSLFTARKIMLLTKIAILHIAYVISI